MLPSLRKINDKEYGATETKVYNPPSQLSQFEPKRDQPSHESVRVKSKIGGGGFKLSGEKEEPTKGESVKIYESYNTYNSRLSAGQKKSNTNLGSEIKMIQRKIRQCQKKIETDKRRKFEEQRNQENRYDQDFQQIIRRELEMHGFKKEDPNKGFDYLTNPGGKQPEEFVDEGLPEPEVVSAYNIPGNVERLERFYQNSLKKKFQRRETFPHKACQRKTPKLYITQKTNALLKVGRPLNEEEHKFRIMSKQTTPQEIYPVIPNFAVVKDNLSKSILAYLGDYKPFIDKTKEKVSQEVRREGEDIVIENTNKSLSISN